jgi:hypothetical protein
MSTSVKKAIDYLIGAIILLFFVIVDENDTFHNRYINWSRIHPYNTGWVFG